MNSHDIMMILVMSFPMFLFAVYPGLKLGDYLEEHYHISEAAKRAVIVTVTISGSLALAAYMQLG